MSHENMFFITPEEPQFYELFENVLLGFLSEIISETLQEPIETFLQLFKEKRIKCSDLSWLRQGKKYEYIYAEYDSISKKN